MSGFTLIEALVVVAIIAISATLAAPALMNSIAIRRSNEVTHDVVRIGARARSEAMAYGRAHLLVYETTSTGAVADDGRMQLWRGRVDRCGSNNWGAIVVGACADSRDCLDQVDMGAYSGASHRVRLRPTGALAMSLCFQPDGELLASADGGIFTMTPPSGTDAVEFLITRFVGNTQEGVTRAVAFPFGGSPRVQR